MEKVSQEEEAARNSDVEKVRREKRRDGEDAGARKGRKVAKHCVFPMSCGSRGLKSRLAKAAGAETFGQMRNEHLHAVVARSTFWSKKCQNTSCSEHFWKSRCWKSVRRCGAKHICKSKVAKHVGLGAFLEVGMSQKCTPLWREAHVQVKMLKAPGVRTTFWRFDGDLMSKKCTLLRREARLSNVSKTGGFGPLLMCRMSFCSQIDGHRKT